MTNARLSMWGEDECLRAHQATLAVLVDPGAEVQNARARELLAAAGATIDGTRASIPAKLVEDALTSAPKSFIVMSRGGHDPLVMEQGNTYYGTGGDCLHTRDLDSGERRRARLADVTALAVLSERLPGIDFVMSMGLAEDGPTESPELAEFTALLKGTRKPLVVDPVCGPESLAAFRRMAALAGEPNSFMIYAMPTSPFLHNESALGRVMGCAELGIPLIYASGACPGFTAPASRSAMVVETNAEVLSGLVIHQLARPGAPFVYGTSAPAMSMSTTSIVYVAPESYAMQQTLCDMGRSYGLPSWTVGGCADSNTLDTQWAAETANSLIMAALTGCTMVHDLGYLESGVQSSHESILFADELVGFVRAYLDGVPLDDLDKAVSEIRAVGPGGDHLARPHTRKHYRDFWQPSLVDQWAHDHWAADGGKTLNDRLTAWARELHSQPPVFTLDPSVADELDAIVSERRTA